MATEYDHTKLGQGSVGLRVREERENEGRGLLGSSEVALGCIRPRHREIMRRLICGQQQVQIAQEMGFTQSRLSIIVRSPLFQAALKQLENQIRDRVISSVGDVTDRLLTLQPKAVDVLESLMTDEKKSPNVRRGCARDILDLAASGRKKDHGDGMSEYAKLVDESYRRALEEREREKLAKELVGIATESESTSAIIESELVSETGSNGSKTENDDGLDLPEVNSSVLAQIRGGGSGNGTNPDLERSAQDQATLMKRTEAEVTTENVDGDESDEEILVSVDGSEKSLTIATILRSINL